MTQKRKYWYIDTEQKEVMARLKTSVERSYLNLPYYLYIETAALPPTILSVPECEAEEYILKDNNSVDCTDDLLKVDSQSRFFWSLLAFFMKHPVDIEETCLHEGELVVFFYDTDSLDDFYNELLHNYYFFMDDTLPASLRADITTRGVMVKGVDIQKHIGFNESALCEYLLEYLNGRGDGE